MVKERVERRKRIRLNSPIEEFREKQEYLPYILKRNGISLSLLTIEKIDDFPFAAMEEDDEDILLLLGFAQEVQNMEIEAELSGIPQEIDAESICGYAAETRFGGW